MLAIEAVLIGGVAALLGVLIGTAYGLLGAQSVMASFGSLVVSIPGSSSPASSPSAS